MVKNPPEGTQRVIPYLCYEDAPKAIEFLCSTFGFEERMRMDMGGKIGHAELGLGDNVLMLASPHEEVDMAGLASVAERHAMVLVYVDDVDAHFEHAKSQGAEIVQPLQDQFYGDRSYTTRDLEGMRWTFATHVKDVAPEDMMPPAE